MIKVPDKPHLDLTTPIGRGFIAFLSALAQDERQWIVKRANDGRATARKRGVHMGRGRCSSRYARSNFAGSFGGGIVVKHWLALQQRLPPLRCQVAGRSSRNIERATRC
jgi:Resolvase, N terminal domain